MTVTLVNGLKMEGSLVRAFARYLLQSLLVPELLPPVLRVSVPYGLASQLPSSDDPALFLAFKVFIKQHTQWLISDGQIQIIIYIYPFIVSCSHKIYSTGYTNNEIYES